MQLDANLTVAAVGRDYPAEVVRTIDGDTVECRVDLGFDVTRTVHVRVRGLYCPELHGADRDRGAAALAAARAILPPGTPARLTAYVSGGVLVKTFDRYVGDLTLLDGRDFATLMIAGGYGGATP